MDDPTEKPRCAAAVYRRDTYRVSRGTKSGFAMHYDRGQCKRLAVEGHFCTQHRRAPYKTTFERS